MVRNILSLSIRLMPKLNEHYTAHRGWHHSSLLERSPAVSYEEAIEKLNSLQSNAATIKKIREQRDVIQSQNILQCKDFLATIGITMPDIDNLRVIHVSGTKGKGSTCAFVERILRDSGLRTGLYTSPHLVHVRERIRVNGEPISKQLFTKQFFSVYNSLQLYHYDNMPAYFKFLTLLAFQIFVKEKVDVAIVEVGIGGEYDCTNVVERPSVCGITTLDYDHVSILGSSLSEIAWHKAGILKTNCAAVFSPTCSEALAVIKKRADEKRSDVHESPPLDAYNWPEECSIGIPGRHQELNVSLALQLSRAWMQKHQNSFIQSSWSLGEPFWVSPEWCRSIAQCQWEGRSQTVQQDGITYFLDGAHTPKSMEACAEWVKGEMEKLPNETKKILLFQCTADRMPSTLLPYLKPIGFAELISCPTRINVKPKKSSDSTNLNMSEIEQMTKSRQCLESWESDGQVYDCISSAIDHIRANNGGNVAVLVTGSLHLVGGVLSIIKS